MKLLSVMVASFLFCSVVQAQLIPKSAETDFYFAHITDGGTNVERWTTQFRFVNADSIDTGSTSGILYFVGQDGQSLLLDFGNGPRSSLSITIPYLGAVVLETRGNANPLRAGFVYASFDAPVQATAEFRIWRGGTFSNGASVDGIAPNFQFLTFADFYTGIAVANVNTFPVSCSGSFINSQGILQGTTTLSLGALNQTAFNVGDRLGLPENSVGSFFIDCPAVVVSLAIAGNNRGITSSLPSGSMTFPTSHFDHIKRIFKHLVKSLNSTNGFHVGNPELRISSEHIVNATAGNNIVTINLALAELLADSPSELAFAIAHELGHIFQTRNGPFANPTEPEIDADLFATFALVLTGYDPYGGGGVLGKLGMIGGRTDVVSQYFDNINSPHTSFSNRLGTIYEVIDLVCADALVVELCTAIHDVVHPHMPTPLGEQDGVQKQSVVPSTSGRGVSRNR